MISMQSSTLILSFQLRSLLNPGPCSQGVSTENFSRPTNVWRSFAVREPAILPRYSPKRGEPSPSQCALPPMRPIYHPLALNEHARRAYEARSCVVDLFKRLDPSRRVFALLSHLPRGV